MDTKEKVEFKASPLGTKEYWDTFYESELKNYNEHKEEGAIWFGVLAEKRMLNFMNQSVAKTSRIVDIGCGNGSLLRKLLKNGYTTLTGVDYSENAVEFARQSSSEEACSINYQVADLTAEPTNPTLKGKFDVVLDKGTWDAMSLAEDHVKMLVNYRRAVEELFDPSADIDQFFVIVSCNFTLEEIKEMFSRNCLLFHCELPAQQSFTFGGKQGSTTSGSVFKFNSC